MEKSLLHRKDGIILTAIEVIDELGLQGLSTREMARRQGISEGTLFKHFKTKNDIILAVLEYFSQYDSEIIYSTKIKKLKPKEAIIYFICAYAEYYQSYPAITAIGQAYDMLRRNPQLSMKVEDIVANRFSFLTETIQAAQKIGEINPTIDSENLTHIIMGSFQSICLKWRFSNYQFSLKERIISTLEMVLTAFNEGEQSK